MQVSHIKWVLLGAVVVVMLPWLAVVYSRERNSREVIEMYPEFAQPRVQIHFRKDIRWDPMSFLGRGRDLGVWDWSEKGVILTPKGQNMFGDTGKQITGDMVVGKREISTIKSVQPANGKREVLFLYVWTDLTDAAKLMSQAPVKGREYQAVATLSEKGGSWEVTSLSAPDYARSVEILTAETKHP